MSAITQSLKNYTFSDYEIDKQHQGYFGLSGAGFKGRVISIIDIPSQLVKGIIGIASGVAIAVCGVVIGVFLTLGAVGAKCVSATLFFTSASDETKDRWTEHYRYLFQGGLKSIAEGAITFIMSTISVGIFKTTAIAGNLLGVISPEMGRKARILTLVNNATTTLFNAKKTNSLNFTDELKGGKFRHLLTPQTVEVGTFWSTILGQFCQGHFRDTWTEYKASNNALRKAFFDHTGIQPFLETECPERTIVEDLS